MSVSDISAMPDMASQRENALERKNQPNIRGKS
jgi:hypothetical protein